MGEAALRGKITAYASRFDLVEISGEPGRQPRRGALVAMRAAAPAGFVWSVTVPARIAALEPFAERAAVLQHARGVAEALGARFFVLSTPAGVMPSARSERALTALGEELALPGVQIAWEPRGAWPEERQIRVAASLGWLLVQDLSREARRHESETVYTRLRALGPGARVGAPAAEHLAEQLEGAREAFVVVEGAGAGRVRAVLRELLASGASHGEAGDDADDADDRDEDGDDLGGSDADDADDDDADDDDADDDDADDDDADDEGK